ncbi:hypothetical protein A3K64_02530 [Candidatus Micrarchaeota archaeon RBG_16_36_9]|nr:MAG: hypothetical protein A3K64_02530 [Candidatus Micrarchaeota archaeon RBG_16_36_9]
MSEQTYLIFHPTRLAFLKWYLISIFLITFGISLFVFVSMPSPISSYTPYILLSLSVIGLLLTLIAELLRKNDKYAITSFRIIEKSGIINIEEDSVYWEKLSNYELHQNAFDRIFNTGTIKLWSTGGEEEPEVVIKKSPDIKRIRIVLDKLIQKR